MATSMDAVTDARIWSDLIAPRRPDFAPEMGRAMLSVRFADTQNARMHQLDTRNTSGHNYRNRVRGDGELPPRWQLPGAFAGEGGARLEGRFCVRLVATMDVAPERLVWKSATDARRAGTQAALW